MKSFQCNIFLEIIHKFTRNRMIVPRSPFLRNLFQLDSQSFIPKHSFKFKMLYKTEDFQGFQMIPV